MNRRDFLKSTLALTMFGAFGKFNHSSGSSHAAEQPSAKEPQVTRRKFGNTSLSVPLLGFGMMRLPTLGAGSSNIDETIAQKIVDRAMQAGINYFDTAYPYHGGKSEVFAGKALKKYPRESYLLATKLPIWAINNQNDIERIFNEQLKKCQVDYFDFYLIHALNSFNWEKVKEFNVYDFLLKKKQEGKIRNLGFSFHDSPEVLKTIAETNKWDFAMIQLNYLDWDLYRSKEQYEILTRNKIPVWVMEPLRGGALASLNKAATDILHNAAPGESNASWALRYAGSLPNVTCILSGMTLPEHLEDNIKTMTPFKPLSDPERNVLDKALAAYKSSGAIPCTSCRYCMPCPVGVDIPRIFGLYNQYKITGNSWLLKNGISALPEDARPDACVDCGMCLKKCPQQLNIPAELKKIQNEL